ncbi:MAG TPA: hypothetical protein VLQ79_00765 [Myxococcaceae bacterium]|nr:hypothetical protein [Myxococcaceae bacterium]
MTRLVQLAIVLLSDSALAAPVGGTPCTDDRELLAIHGSWTAGADVGGTAGSGRPQGASQQVSARIDRLAELVRAASPEPRGMEAIWYRKLSAGPPSKAGAEAYGLNALYKAWSCNQNLHQTQLDDETGTWVHVFVNHLGWFAEEQEAFQVDGRPAYLLTPRSGAFKGIPAYAGIHNKSSNTGQTFSRGILVTRPGESPLVPVTRRQLLEGFVRSAAAQAASQRSMIENAAMDPARKADLIRRIQHGVEKRQAPARARLEALSREDGDQPAILGPGGVLDFNEFATEDRGGRALVRLDPRYFAAKVPPHAPQFVIVYWRWQKSVASQALRDEFEQRFDSSGVAALLDR